MMKDADLRFWAWVYCFLFLKFDTFKMMGLGNLSAAFGLSMLYFLWAWGVNWFGF